MSIEKFEFPSCFKEGNLRKALAFAGQQPNAMSDFLFCSLEISVLSIISILQDEVKSGKSIIGSPS